MKRLVNIHKQELVVKTAEELKNLREITPPDWSVYVKTGAHKQRPPVKADWWHTRSASVLIKVMEVGPVGIEKLRVKYGGKKRRGHQPPEFRKASGNILRKIIQQLEKAGLVKTNDPKGRKGRIITTKGLKLITAASKTIGKTATEAKPKVVEPKADAKKEN